MSNKNLVFVYGTLKRSECNHSLIKDSKFISKSVTISNYLFLDNGLPYVIDEPTHKDSVCVHGEVYEVSDKMFDDIDSLEGHPIFYERKKIWVSDSYNCLYVWIYFLKGFKTFKNFTVVTDGNWKL